MKYGRHGWSYLFLRLGLGLTFLWIGIDILRHPELWIGYAPAKVPLGLTRETALQASGFFDVVVGLALTVPVLPKLMGALAAAHLLAIIVTQGIDAVLIRDVGLLGAALAILFWPTHYHQKKWRGRLSIWRRRDREE